MTGFLSSLSPLSNLPVLIANALPVSLAAPWPRAYVFFVNGLSVTGLRAI